MPRAFSFVVHLSVRPDALAEWPRVSSAFATIKKLALWALDTVCVMASYLICLAIKFQGEGMTTSEVHTHKVMLVILTVLVIIFNLASTRNRRGLMHRTGAQEFWVAVSYNLYLLAGIALFSLALRLQPTPPRSVVLGTVALNVPMMLVLRSLAKVATRKVFGDQRAIGSVLMIVEPSRRAQVERDFCLGTMYRICGWLSISPDGQRLQGTVEGRPVSCGLAQLHQALGPCNVTDVYVAAFDLEADAKGSLIEAIQSLGAICHLGVEVPESGVETASLGYFGEMPTITYAGRGSALYLHLVKRVLDVVFSLLVTVVMIIPGALICLVIALQSKGSPLYYQERLGKGARHFRLLKFRSMVADADDVQKYFTPQQLQEWHLEHKVDNDPRITSVGRFLRKTSLDEFPQFLNVLKGDMSVVGPRPIVDEELHHFGKDADELLSVRPGITGWWQVEARNDADFASGKRQKLEMYYVRHASFRLDLEVVKRTVGAVFRGTGK